MNSLKNSWKDDALNTFLKTAGNIEFPCLFGRKSIKQQTYIPFFFSKTENRYSELLQAFIDYTNFVKTTPVKERLYSPLIIFFDLELTNQKKSQHQFAWNILNWLHSQDKEDWPHNIPKDPSDSNWCFCFNKVQLFINMSTSQHKVIKSRNLGKYLVLVINPRENFDFIASGEKGQKIRAQIRGRIFKYNNGYIPYELGSYGDGSKEWLQYQLEEEELPRPKKCPFSNMIKENK